MPKISLASPRARHMLSSMSLLSRCALLILPLLAACQPLRPYAPIVTSRPVNFVTLPAGQRVHVERYGQHGPPILLIHGFCASTYCFRHLAPQLARDHRVFAIDLNGFGYTQRPGDPEAYNLDGQARLVIETAKQLKLDRVHLVGHSFGAVVALRAAELDPQRCDRLVLTCPAASVGLPLVMRFTPTRYLLYPFVRLQLSSPEGFRATARNAFHQPGLPTLEDSEVCRNLLLVEGFTDAYHGFGHAIDPKPGKQLPAGENLRKPILVIAGRHDRIIPLDLVRSTTRHLHHPELVILENSGHAAMEEEPRAMARHIRRFLSR